MPWSRVCVAVLLAASVACSNPPVPPTGPSPQPPAPPPVAHDPCARAVGPETMPFFVYRDGGDVANHFHPSGFFGDFADLTIDTAHSANPRSGATSIRIAYAPRGPLNFAGIFWQCGDFGNLDAGFNLSRASMVRFWARADAPGKAEFKVGGIGRGVPPAPFPDSLASTSTSPVVVDLGTDWREFVIPVSGDRSYIQGGFMFVTSTAQNSGGLELFLDEISWQ
jgi:hypothetical protein